MHVVLGALEGAGIGLGVWLLTEWARRRGWIKEPGEMITLFGKQQK